MIRFIRYLLARLGLKAEPTWPPRRIRLRVTRSTIMSLYRATIPTKLRGEPLAFLSVRYASEASTDVVLAVGVTPFPDRAYVDGPAGANFDTRWSIEAANKRARSNAGLFLAHSHGGLGKPGFSSVDRKTNQEVMAPLSRGMHTVPYGAIVLSDNDATAVLALNGRLVTIDVELVVDGVGALDLTK